MYQENSAGLKVIQGDNLSIPFAKQARGPQRVSFDCRPQIHVPSQRTQQVVWANTTN